MYQSTKKFGHDLGLSCAFRQWKADSHCKFVHGYALSFKFVFEAKQLDDRNWVVDFGGLKGLKKELSYLFDHTFIIAKDDPLISHFKELEAAFDIRVLKNVGCEAFAEVAYNLGVMWLKENNLLKRVKVVSCECSEHGANSAVYLGD